MEKGEPVQLVAPNALVVHVLVPVVVAVAVKLMATVPPGSMLFALPPMRVVVITPPEAVGVFQVRVVGPGSVATTLNEPGVPAPAGIVTRTQSITSVAVLVLVTVSVYEVAVFTVADVGLIVAVNCAVSVNVVCAVQLDAWPVAVARNRTPTSERSGAVRNSLLVNAPLASAVAVRVVSGSPLDSWRLMVIVSFGHHLSPISVTISPGEQSGLSLRSVG